MSADSAQFRAIITEMEAIRAELAGIRGALEAMAETGPRRPGRGGYAPAAPEPPGEFRSDLTPAQRIRLPWGLR